MQYFNSAAVTAIHWSQISSIIPYNYTKHATDGLKVNFFSNSGCLCIEGNAILIVEDLELVLAEFPDAVH